MTSYTQGIPSVIVLDAKTGNFISDNGRAEIMQATNDESKKALVSTWLSKDAIPIEQAVLGQGGGGDNLLVKVLKYIIQRPGKSALVLFCHMNSCVQYEDSLFEYFI